MTHNPSEGNAVIYCEGALSTTSGKTAHGLLRRSAMRSNGTLSQTGSLRAHPTRR